MKEFGDFEGDFEFQTASSLYAHTATSWRVRGSCVFILCLVAKNEARKPNSASRVPRDFARPLNTGVAQARTQNSHPKGLCPLDSRGARLELSIFPPRGKNVYQHFSSVAKMSFANLISASGNPKIPLLQGFVDVPLPFGKKFLSRTPPFSICEGLASPIWALLRSPDFVLDKI